jgi:hypothetical protein
MTAPDDEDYDRDAAEAQFRWVMNIACERAWANGVEEAAMAAMFDVLNKELPKS